MSKIAIVDYGISNIQSLFNAFNKIGAEPKLVCRPEEIKSFAHLVLPGVGAFKTAMEQLNSIDGLVDAIYSSVKLGNPILGICLGMQLLANSSREGEATKGLGLIDAEVVPFEPKPGLKIPHMGWNSIEKKRPHNMLNDVDDNSDVYFVHSFHMLCAQKQDILLTSKYGKEFTAMVARENVYGMQFHPEKSQKTGLRLLANFLDL